MITHIQLIESAIIKINNKIIYKINKGVILNVSINEVDNNIIEKHINKIIKAKIFNKGIYNIKDKKYSLIILPQKLINENKKSLREEIMEININKENYERFLIKFEKNILQELENKIQIIKINYKDNVELEIHASGPINYIIKY